jgi:hypothetical protein
VGELSLSGWEAPRLLAFFCGGMGEGRSVDSMSMYSRVFRVHNSTQLSEAGWPCVGGAGVGGRGGQLRSRNGERYKKKICPLSHQLIGKAIRHTKKRYCGIAAST